MKCKVESKMLTGKLINKQRILSCLKNISENKGLVIYKDKNSDRMYIGGNIFRLYFSIDTVSDNSIIWNNLEFPLIADFYDVDNQFNKITKKLIYDLMKEVEDSGINVEPF